MITLVEALNFKCFRYLQQPLGPFHVLAGANGTGKSTFLDVIAFVSDFIAEGLKSAIEKRTPHFEDLVWMGKPGRIELAIEAKISETEKAILPIQKYDRIRYELAIGNDLESKEIQIFHETILLKIDAPPPMPKRTVFPKLRGAPLTLIAPRKGLKKSKRIFIKVLGGMETYYPETEWEEKPSEISRRPAPLKSGLDHLPEDEKKFPVSTWFKHFMCEEIKRIRTSSPFLPHTTQKKTKSELSQLSWIWNEMKSQKPAELSKVMAFLQSLLPDLKGIKSIQNKEGQYDLVLEYKNNLKLPMRSISEGSYCILSMVFPFFQWDPHVCVYLIEEPENGLHPKTLENLLHFFSSASNAQILLTTYSPIVLDQCDPSQILFFAKTPEGASDVIGLHQHPKLKNWKGEPSLSTLFAKGEL